MDIVSARKKRRRNASDNIKSLWANPSAVVVVDIIPTVNWLRTKQKKKKSRASRDVFRSQEFPEQKGELENPLSQRYSLFTGKLFRRALAWRVLFPSDHLNMLQPSAPSLKASWNVGEPPPFRGSATGHLATAVSCHDPAKHLLTTTTIAGEMNYAKYFLSSLYFHMLV